MKKSEFKKLLVDSLISKGYEVTEEKIKSALSKTVRHMRNTIGETEWSEGQIGNAECFFHEFKEQKTFNRQSAIIMRRGY